MAMGPRTGGSGGFGVYSRGRPQPNRPRPAAVVRPMYQDFQPISEWKTEDGALILLVHLPGFLKEQITYLKDESKRYIRVYGERPLLDNRRLRFYTTYTVPQDCSFNQITAHFDKGILKFTFPRLTPAAINPPDHDDQKKKQQEEEAGSSTQQDQQQQTEEEKEPSLDEPRKALQALNQEMGGRRGEQEKKTAEDHSVEKVEETTAVTKEDSSRIDQSLGVAAEKKSNGEDDDEKRKEEAIIRGKEEESAIAAAAGKTTTTMAEKNEERQLVVNICAATFVLVAFSLDLYRTFASSSSN